MTYTPAAVLSATVLRFRRLAPELLTRFENSETPIDKLSEDVKLRTRLIKEMSKKLKTVETEVRDAFKKLNNEPENAKEPL